MTLILTEIGPLGIAMATDSAVTFHDVASGAKWVNPTGQLKLHKCASIHAGVSCWGLGLIDGGQTDAWLERFLVRNKDVSDLADLATRLAVDLNRMLGKNKDGQPRAGFHVAGYLNDGDGPAPSLFHVHDGPSDVLRQRGVTIDPHVFNANHDCPPAVARQAAAQGESMIWRNGDWRLHAVVFGALEQLFKTLRPHIVIPMSVDLRDRADYLTFWIRTMSEIYRHSNFLRGIAGHIPFLAIGPNGYHSEGTRYV